MKLHTISINNLKRRKAKMAFLTIGLMVGIATIVTLVTLTRSMSSDIERKMDEFGANILITPQSNGLAMNYGGISLGGVTFDQREIRESDLAKVKTIQNHKNISAISPKVLGGITINNHDVLLVGVHFESELKMKQWWKVFGNEPKSEHDLLLGTDAAKVLNVSPGDKLEIKGEQFTVAGVLEQTGS
jgi:putative ABC transport system permease protein